MEIKSPLSGSCNIKKESEIKTDFIIKKYQQDLGVDVSHYFKGLDAISIYQCLDSGYRFYYPFALAGESEFYEKLQKHPWYYMDWKWEHEKTLTIINDAKNLLEIGCAQGEFLEKIHTKGIACTGLELNAHAAKVGRKKGLHILEESIQNHAKKHKEHYDVVCSFQVAEHVASIGEFIQASLDALKPGGKLIISVPNNDSVVFKAGVDIVLNMPPHHMGLWNMNSLIKLQHFFPVQIEDIYLEPLQSYHAWFAKLIAEKKFKEKLHKKHMAWIPFAKKIGNTMINANVRSITEHIIGHSIMVMYTKK